MSALEIGLHFHRFPLGDSQGPATPAPDGLSYDSVRTHDAGVQWCLINPASGFYNWARMDAIVAAHSGKSIVYTLYGTPEFALLRPAEASHFDAYGSPGGAGAAKQCDVIVFVSALLARYPGRIKAVEIWNEPLFDGVIKQDSFFWGSAGEMVMMGIGVRTSVNRYNAENGGVVEVWSPGFLGGATMRAFFEAGTITKGKQIIDAVCWHPYGCWLLPDHSHIVTGWSGVDMVRNVMGGSGIPDKKLVISEYGIGIDIHDQRLIDFLALSDDGRYAYPIRLLSALDKAGVSAIYFYAFDQPLCGDLLNDEMLRDGINDVSNLLTK